MSENDMKELLTYDKAMFKVITKKMSFEELEQLEEYLRRVLDKKGDDNE